MVPFITGGELEFFLSSCRWRWGVTEGSFCGRWEVIVLMFVELEVVTGT